MIGPVNWWLMTIRGIGTGTGGPGLLLRHASEIRGAKVESTASGDGCPAWGMSHGWGAEELAGKGGVNHRGTLLGS